MSKAEINFDAAQVEKAARDAVTQWLNKINSDAARYREIERALNTLADEKLGYGLGGIGHNDRLGYMVIVGKERKATHNATEAVRFLIEGLLSAQKDSSDE